MPLYAGQVAQRVGWVFGGFEQRFAQPIDTVASIITSPWVLGGLTCFGLSAVVWLLVLARMNLSQAYPCVALGFVLNATARAWRNGHHGAVIWFTGRAKSTLPSIHMRKPTMAMSP